MLVACNNESNLDYPRGVDNPAAAARGLYEAGKRGDSLSWRALTCPKKRGTGRKDKVIDELFSLIKIESVKEIENTGTVAKVEVIYSAEGRRRSKDTMTLIKIDDKWFAC